MGWEQRGSSTFFYQKRRVGGRVVSNYLGRGEWVAAAAALLQHDQRERERERVWALQTIGEAEAATAAAIVALHDLDRIARAAVRAALIEDGFHERKGEWRRRRGGA